MSVGHGKSRRINPDIITLSEEILIEDVRLRHIRLTKVKTFPSLRLRYQAKGYVFAQHFLDYIYFVLRKSITEAGVSK